MSILDKVVTLQEVVAKSLKIIMSEVGAGKTSFHKDMPDVAGGDILYLTIGNDKGFNQLKADTRFKTPKTPIKTVYAEKNGRKIAIKKRVLPQLIDILEAFKNEEHDFAGLTVDAISTLQEQIEMEIKFDKSKNLDWDDWSAIKKAMFRVYELLEEIAEQGYEVSLQTHFQIREYEDAYSGDKTTRLLPLMTENNAIRILKNADAVVMIKIMPDGKDRKIVHRMSIVGGHPSIPTKIRNEHNLSFDGILFENLTYEGLIKLMQVESLEEAADLDGVKLKKEGKKSRKKLRKSKQKETEDEDTDEEIEEVEEVKETTPSKKSKPVRKSKKSKSVVEEDDEEDEIEIVKTKKKPSKVGKKTPSKTKKSKKVEEDEEEDDEEVDTSEKKKPAKRKPPKKSKKVEDDEDEEDEVVDLPKPKKPKKSSKGKKKKIDIDEDDVEDAFEGDEDLEDDDLFDE